MARHRSLALAYRVAEADGSSHGLVTTTSTKAALACMLLRTLRRPSPHKDRTTTAATRKGQHTTSGPLAILSGAIKGQPAAAHATAAQEEARLVKVPWKVNAFGKSMLLATGTLMTWPLLTPL